MSDAIRSGAALLSRAALGSMTESLNEMTAPHSEGSPTDAGPSPVPAPFKPRFEWVDYARGLGIFLVVVGHTLRGNLNSGLLAPSATVQFVDDWIYAFHMPLFFYLSGLFAERSAEKGPKRFVADKLRTIAYPYFLWSALQTGVQVALAGYTNGAARWDDLAALPYRPPMQFWFLYALFLCFMIFLAARLAGLNRWTFLAASVAFAALQARVDLGHWGPLYQVGSNLPFFAFGVATRAWAFRTLSDVSRPGAVLAAAIGYGLVTLLVSAPETNAAFRASAALLGIASTLALAGLLARCDVLGAVRFWGTESMPIFVAHTLASAGFRIAIQKLARVSDPTLHLIGGIAVGLYGPILLAALARRAGCHIVFSWPPATVTTRARAGPGR